MQTQLLPEDEEVAEFTPLVHLQHKTDIPTPHDPSSDDTVSYFVEMTNKKKTQKFSSLFFFHFVSIFYFDVLSSARGAF